MTSTPAFPRPRSPASTAACSRSRCARCSAASDGAGVMWHHPAVFKDTMRFGRKTEKWDRLDPNLASFATMAAAAEIGCSFCLDLSYFMTHNRGLDETKAREVPRWRESDGLHAGRATGDGVRRGDVPDPADRHRRDGRPRCSRTSGPPGLVELTARVGFMNISARGNIALGIRSEEFAEACGLPPLAAPAVARSAVA